MLDIKRVNQDKRGEIYVISGDSLPFPELTLLITKQGFARGGCVHENHDEHTIILDGEVTYFKKGRAPSSLKADETQFSGTFNPKGVPHYMVSLTNSVVLEWGAPAEEKGKHYKPYRDIVERINKEA